MAIMLNALAFHARDVEVVGRIGIRSTLRLLVQFESVWK